MSKLEGVTPRRMADEFVAELFKRYRAPHVRRVASWIGFIVYGVHKLNDGEWDIPRLRQLRFQMDGKTVVAGFDHRDGGKIAFRALNGRTRGPIIAAIKNLDQIRLVDPLPPRKRLDVEGLRRDPLQGRRSGNCQREGPCRGRQGRERFCIERRA